MVFPMIPDSYFMIQFYLNGHEYYITEIYKKTD